MRTWSACGAVNPKRARLWGSKGFGGQIFTLDKWRSLKEGMVSDIHILPGGILWTPLNGLTYEDAWEFVKIVEGATGVGPSQPFDFSNTSIKSPLFAAKKQVRRARRAGRW